MNRVQNLVLQNIFCKYYDIFLFYACKNVHLYCSTKPINLSITHMHLICTRTALALPYHHISNSHLCDPMPMPTKVKVNLVNANLYINTAVLRPFFTEAHGRTKNA